MGKILILGGSAEAFALADALAGSTRRVITSLAGRTRERRIPAGDLRVGGFGGEEGLADYLRAEAIDAVVDATHPFAATITRNAAAATLATGVPLLRIAREPWPAEETWIHAQDLDEAARLIPEGPAFLTIGRTGLSAFAARPDLEFIARMIDPPERDPGVRRLRLVFGRGPFDAADEQRFLEENGIRCLVAKNSGGPAGKLAAARALGIAVVMVRPPERPAGVDAVPDVAAALNWLRDRNLFPAEKPLGAASVRRV